MLDLVAEKIIKVETNLLHGLSEVSKMVDLALSGKMQGKPMVVVDKFIIAKDKSVVAARGGGKNASPSLYAYHMITRDLLYYIYTHSMHMGRTYTGLNLKSICFS